MKKIFFGIFIAVVLFFSIWGIHYVASPINSTDAVLETVEYAINDKQAVIIREEEVYYSDIDGTLYNHASEGDRVAKDSPICTIFSGNISDDSLNELRTLDKKIRHRKSRLRESTIYGIDGIDTESKIAGIIKDIGPAGEDNDVVKISDYKEDLNNLRAGVEISDEDMLQSLIFEKEALETRISTNKSEISTEMSGVFTTYIDGLEEVLLPESMDGYTVEYIRSMTFSDPRKLTGKTVSADNAICKVVNNHIWYVAMVIPTDEADKHSEGESVSLRFNSIAGQLVKGTINRISEENENGSKLVIIKCPSYFEGAFSYRAADIDLIFESYTGYKVPVHAIRSDDDGKQYVLGMIGSNEYKCYCDILYTERDMEYIIVESVEGAQNKLSRMERIVLGER